MGTLSPAAPVDRTAKLMEMMITLTDKMEKLEKKPRKQTGEHVKQNGDSILGQI